MQPVHEQMALCRATFRQRLYRNAQYTLLPLHHHSGRAELGNRCTFSSVPPSSRPSPYRSSDTLHSRYQKVLADKTLQQHIAVIDAATGKAYTHGTLQQDSTQLAQILL